MDLRVQFLGGAGTVTGSKYLVSFRNRHVLVDCGLFQGVKTLRQLNWNGFPIPASQVDAIILTHAHIDHSGYIPRLINKGFKGRIYCTEATRDLCQILLPDAGHLMEEEADYLNRHKRSKHNPALPLFTMKEGQRALEFFAPAPFHQAVALGSDMEFELRYVGHILGAASVMLKVGDRRLFFSGDVGRPQDPIFYPPAAIPDCDYLIVESTYGNRRHSRSDVLTDLAQVVNDTYKRGGSVLVPAFAIGRAYSLMHFLHILKREGRIPPLPIYLNSPMAADFSAIFQRHHDLHKLTVQDCQAINADVEYVRTVEESIALNERKEPSVIISASGMLAGGRVLHHLKTLAPNERNTILLTGFQAAGTRGEVLARGGDEVKVHGEYVPVRAQVHNLDNMSAHADFVEIVNWMKASQIKPRAVFVTHGEPSAADEMRRRLEETFSWNVCVPNNAEVFEPEAS